MTIETKFRIGPRPSRERVPLMDTMQTTEAHADDLERAARAHSDGRAVALELGQMGYRDGVDAGDGTFLGLVNCP